MPSRPGLSARQRAVTQLCRAESGGAYAGSGSLDGSDERDARQVTDLVAGVTRWRRYLDFLIGQFYLGTAAKMELPLKQILRIALYELVFARKPPHAAVHEAVSLARKVVRPGAGSLVNAVLRAFLASDEGLPSPATGDAAEDLAVRYSHPTWMVRRWLERFGAEESRVLLASNNARPAYYLRSNPLAVTTGAFWRKLDALGVAWEPARHLEDFVRVRRLQPVLRAGWIEQGLCAVQDLSAGLVVEALDVNPGHLVVDLCAAPGGKTLCAAARMRDRGRIVALDIHENRLRRLRRAASQQRISIVEPVAADARKYRLSLRADRVLVDAPCSGLGVMAKRSDLRWKRSPGDMAQLMPLQDALLDAGARILKPGGVLVYGTCTIEPEENQDRVKAFLDRHPDFCVDPIVEPKSLTDENGFLVTLPHTSGMDGVFAARLRKESGTQCQ